MDIDKKRCWRCQISRVATNKRILLLYERQNELQQTKNDNFIDMDEFAVYGIYCRLLHIISIKETIKQLKSSKYAWLKYQLFL